MKQISFLPRELLIHGGAIQHKKRKSARPISRNRPLHLVLKSKRKILYPHRAALVEEIKAKTAHFGLKAYSIAVNHDHIHFILRISSRRLYRAFIRALTGVVARKLGKGIWKLLPFTRVMAWGKDFKQGLAYLEKNRDEASGARAYEPRNDWVSKWRKVLETPA